MHVASNIELEPVTATSWQISYLFKLLVTRKHYVSHTQNPSREAHAAFVEQHPYRYWWMVRIDDQYIGACYVTFENSIGLSLEYYSCEIVGGLIEKLKKVCSPLSPIPSIRPKDFYVNVPISNLALQQSMAELGYQSTQISFRLI